MERNIPTQRIETAKPHSEWADRLFKQAWWEHRNILTPDKLLADCQGGAHPQDKLVEGWRFFRELHNVLLSIGGYETCFPLIEEDMPALLDRGRYYPGRSKLMKGQDCKCHANACGIWLANKDDKDVSIATGYALSADGLWRQHSWVIHRYRTRTQNRVRLVETTVKRIAYFGFELTEEESEAFCYNNDIY